MRIKTGGRVKYTGNCFLCEVKETCRWHRNIIENKVICTSCYDKERLKNPIIRKRRIDQRKQWSIKNPYKEAVKTAKEKSMDFLLTEEQFLYKIKDGCFYCGGVLGYSGIKLDRINNDKFYSNDTTVACCRICNIAKNTRNITEFYAWIEVVANNKN